MPKIGVGLDIGTSSVKIVELKQINKEMIGVNQWGQVPLPEGALTGGVINDHHTVSQALREVFHQSRISLHRAVIAIAGQAVIVRHIKMPIMSDEELANAIRWEAERYIPFPVDEVSLDFEVIQRDLDQGELEVMLVCAHNNIVDSHLEVLKEVGVTPIALDIQPFALMRTFGIGATQSQASVALLDIGAGTSDLTIVKEGVPRFTRIIPVAGTKFTQTVAKNLGVEFDAAEQAKITMSDALFDLRAAAPDSPEFKVNLAMSEGLQELTMELRRSFDYYQLQQRNENVSRLVVSGGGSKIRNLAAYINNQMSIEVDPGLSRDNFSCNEKRREEFGQKFPMLTVAIGLALREVIPDAD